MAEGNNTILPHVKAQLDAAIDSIPETLDSLTEIKISLQEAVTRTFDEAVTLLRLRLEPSVLVNDETTPKRYLYRTIALVLTALGVVVNQAAGTSIVIAVIDALYPLAQFKDVNEEAKRLYAKHVEGRSSGSSASALIVHDSNTRLSRQDARSDNNHGINNGRTQTDSLSRRISPVSYSFRDDSQKFTGSYESPISLHRFKQLFLDTLEQHNIPASHRIQLLPNALKGIALTHYLDKIRGNPEIRTLAQAFSSFEAVFDSAHTRAHAQAFLNATTLESIRDAEQCSTAKALEHAQTRINNVGPMCGPAFQHESHRSNWLANMLRREDWAQT